MNGEVRQESTLDKMIWPVADIIRYIAQRNEIAAGDLVSSRIVELWELSWKCIPCGGTIHFILSVESYFDKHSHAVYTYSTVFDPYMCHTTATTTL